MPVVVVAGSTPYYNAVVTVQTLDSLESASGIDTYDGTYLTVPSVQVSGA
jgi:hypothetical protein